MLPNGSFESAVKRAVALHKELLAFPGGGLTARRYLEEACANANASAAEIKRDRAKITQAHPDDRALVEEFLAKTRAMLVRRDESGAETLAAAAPPASDFVAVMGDGDLLIAAQLEALALDIRPRPLHRLVAIAVLSLTEERPGIIFGQIETDLRTHEAALRKKREQLAELVAEIPKTASLADDLALDWLDVGAGTARLYFKWRGKPTGIAAGDPDALVRWVADQ